MNLRTVLAVALATLSLGSVTTGCSSEESDSDEASATATSALQTQSQDGVMDGVLDTSDDAAPDPEVVAQHVADYPLHGLSPADCATKTRSGSVVTLTLDNCTGPFGQVVVKGSLIATFSKSQSNDLHVDISASKDTTANGRALAYAAQADVTFDGTKRTVTYHGSSSGITKRGKDFSRKTDLTIAADVATHCAKIDGTSTGSVGKYAVDLSISGFEGCRDVCPTAGKAHASVDGPLVKASVDVTFDGSDKAHATISAKKTRELDVALDCQANEAE
jgi:hypothetical protein